jgi:trehalose-6-phosphate synthase
MPARRVERAAQQVDENVLRRRSGRRQPRRPMYGQGSRRGLRHFAGTPDLADRVVLYRAADVLLALPGPEASKVPALEFAAAARDGAALVLSGCSGTVPLLPGAFPVEPCDESSIQAGLTASRAATDADHAARLHGLRDCVGRYDTYAWARGFLASLRAAPPVSSPGGAGEPGSLCPSRRPDRRTRSAY